MRIYVVLTNPITEKLKNMIVFFINALVSRFKCKNYDRIFFFCVCTIKMSYIYLFKNILYTCKITIVYMNIQQTRSECVRFMYFGDIFTLYFVCRQILNLSFMKKFVFQENLVKIQLHSELPQVILAPFFETNKSDFTTPSPPLFRFLETQTHFKTFNHQNRRIF